MAEKPVLYWDSCMFFEWLGEQASTPTNRKAKVLEIVEANRRRENLIITSVITHLEVLDAKLREKDPAAVEDYNNLFDGEFFADVNIDMNIITRAREIRDHYYRPKTETSAAKMMDLGDAIHLAAASIYEVAEFHTRDNDSKKKKIPLLSLYDIYGETKLCGKYDLIIVSPESDQSELFDK